MPKDPFIKEVLVIGAGPIVIGQACEFDYSGTQALLALKEENCRVILINSNPATIMTDPNLADATYIEPITRESLLRIIEQEKPQAILPTVGGQTALNSALDLFNEGILKRFNVSLIGVSHSTIEKAENRKLFKNLVHSLGLSTPFSIMAYTLEEALNFCQNFEFPVLIRTSYTLGGSGSGIAYNLEELEILCKRSFELSKTHGILLEQSLLGWKEYEFEVMGDKAGNGIIVCSIENLDPMGIHTGDSVTIAPAQTLTDKEYQFMRRSSFALMRALDIKTGGFNVQFAVNPENGQVVVIEVNPRVSRSSSLASKATGFPIAKIATKLALGYTLDELGNDLTQELTPASFEPTFDYVVTKIPRFNFDKFRDADTTLTTQMKSVGEIMAVGRCFQESLQKALRSLEIGLGGFDPQLSLSISYEEMIAKLKRPTPKRLLYVADAFRWGLTLDEIYNCTYIDSWFLREIEDIVQKERDLNNKSLKSITKIQLKNLKKKGFSDLRLSQLLKTTEKNLRALRKHYKLSPVFKRIDSCAGEFRTETAYFYSTYEDYCESFPTHKEKILIIGSGPNRIGQGLEFDYCCVHAVLALKKLGYETIMVNCNPSTVSTDYSVSDRLYFEPLITEHILDIIDCEKPKGVIVQFGGQTPLHLAKNLEEAGVHLLGTTFSQIHSAEDRQQFQQLIKSLKLPQPFNGTFVTKNQGKILAQKIGYPMVVRPSYILGGNGITLIKTPEDLELYLKKHSLNGHPILMEEFLEDAAEIEVDAVTDGYEVIIGGIMQQFEQAGTHSGDSSCVLSSDQLSEVIKKQIYNAILVLSRSLKMKGLINVQFAVKEKNLYILEVNPRASRTIPYVSKSTGIPMVELAIHCMLGYRLNKSYYELWENTPLYTVKTPVFPFNKFPGVNKEKGPEMKSTGEVMGVGFSIDEAFLKAQIASKENSLEERFPFEKSIYSLQKYVKLFKVEDLLQRT